MSATRDPGKFFQTNDSLAEQARKRAKASNTNGQPLKLPSKVLAILADPGAKSAVYVAESSGLARKVDLLTLSTRHTFTGASAPLTCLALSGSTSGNAGSGATTSALTLFAGCWDRSIWSWNTASRERGVHFRNGHRDFVKCLAWTQVGSLGVLISGSADTTIVLWDASTGAKLQVLQGHSMAVAALAVDPYSGEIDSDGEEEEEEDHAPAPTSSAPKPAKARPRTLFSASARNINQWTLIPTPSNPLSKLTAAASPDLPGPLTPVNGTIYALQFPHATPTNDDPDLWLASADGCIASLSRHEEWTIDEQFSTGEGHHVRCVAFSEDNRFLAAAGRDEDIYIWDLRAGASGGEVKLLPRFEGHYDEVVSLAILGRGAETRVVSGSLDNTLRIWSLAFVFVSPADTAGAGADGEELVNYTNRIMAGNAFDNAALLAGATGSSSEAILEEADPDDIATHMQMTNDEMKELGDLLDEDHDLADDVDGF